VLDVGDALRREQRREDVAVLARQGDLAGTSSLAIRDVADNVLASLLRPRWRNAPRG
jgi:hypothetical protein